MFVWAIHTLALVLYYFHLHRQDGSACLRSYNGEGVRPVRAGLDGAQAWQG